MLQYPAVETVGNTKLAGRNLVTGILLGSVIADSYVFTEA